MDKAFVREKDKIPAIIGWVLIGIYIFIALLNVLFPQYGLSMYGIGINMTFALLLGVVTIGFRNTFVFNIVSFAITAVIENITIATGFPFGYYIPFTPGPKIVEVPIVVCLGYFNYAFIAWILADLIIPGNDKNNPYLKFWGRMIVGAFAASAIDAIQDPVGVLIDKRWVYPNGGGLFGVPLSNSIGWVILVFTTLFVWELILKRNRKQNADKSEIFQSRWHLLTAILVGIQILPPLFNYLFLSSQTLTDVLGKAWLSSDMYEVLTLLAMHTVVCYMILGIVSYVYKCRDTGYHRKENDL